MNIASHFSGITDPRDQNKISHLLTDIIGLSLIATIAGCEGYEDIEEFGHSRHEWLLNYLSLPKGIPSHDTIERLFESIDPKEFNACFCLWVQEVFNLSDVQLLHIDGKSNRRSKDSLTGKKMLHTVSIFSSSNGLSLGQYKVEEKSNEITAIGPLLDTLDITDQTITIDAMGCQKQIAQAIIHKKGHYILAVKENQKSLLDEIKSAFNTTTIADKHSTIEKDHGRIEERTCHIIKDLRFVEESKHWSGMNSIVRIVSKRTLNTKTSTETRYYISDLQQNASRFLKDIRSHWAIENSLHWVLDILFKEDYCRKRKENAAENFNIIRKMALNIIRNYKADKKSLRRKRLNAAWDTQYLQNLLNF